MMRTSKSQPDNVFATALGVQSDGGERLTRDEFVEVVMKLTRQAGRVNGRLVSQIREDWESLGSGDSHPGTPEATEAFRSFVKRYGALALLDLLRADGQVYAAVEQNCS
jgi:hypothetical protein